MDEVFNVFICWSRARSKHVAEAVREWLPNVIQAARPWMSETDIEKGARSFQEISKRLQGMKAGIVCLTPENLTSPWVLFETGALSKTLDDATRVCPLLLAGLEPKDVPYPLAMFQFTGPAKADIRKLLGSVNNAVSETPVSASSLDYLFDRTWPDLEQKLKDLPEPGTIVKETRKPEDMLAELLDLARADANRRKQADWIEEYVPVLRQLFPLLSQALKAAPQQKAGPFVLEPLDPTPTDRR